MPTIHNINNPEIGSLPWRAEYLESFRKYLETSTLKRGEEHGIRRVNGHLTTRDGHFVMPHTFGDDRATFLWFGLRGVLLWGIEEFQRDPTNVQNQLYAFRALVQVTGYAAKLSVLSAEACYDGFDIIARDAYDQLKAALEAVIREGK